MSRCTGCGAILQTKNVKKEGYVREDKIDFNLCERCFRIRNYGDYKVVLKSNLDFEPILTEIGKKKDLVVLVIDLFMINKNFDLITKYLKNDILLVFTKRDILPKSVNDEKFLNYVENLGIKCIDSIVVSSNKNYELDSLIYKINEYKRSNNVYVVGYTNAGKSTLINKIIYNYSNLNNEITTSILPSTTLNSVKIKINNDLTLIDTPGLIDDNNLINLIDSKLLKKVLPNKEIKPITYQIKTKQIIFIDDLVRIETENNNLTLYVSNSLKIDRTFKETKKLKDLKENVIRIKENQDIVISGLGFIKATKSEVIKIYTYDKIDVYTRKSLI